MDQIDQTYNFITAIAKRRITVTFTRRVTFVGLIPFPEGIMAIVRGVAAVKTPSLTGLTAPSHHAAYILSRICHCNYDP